MFISVRKDFLTVITTFNFILVSARLYNIFDYLLPPCKSLIYCGSNKCSEQRSMAPEQEECISPQESVLMKICLCVFQQTRVVIHNTEIRIEFMPFPCRDHSCSHIFIVQKPQHCQKFALCIPKWLQRIVESKISYNQEIKLWQTVVLTLRKISPVMLPLTSPLLHGKEQLSLEEVATRKIAFVRVHMKRDIARIINYRILHHVVTSVKLLI